MKLFFKKILTLFKKNQTPDNNYAKLRGFFYDSRSNHIRVIFKIKNSRMTYCPKLQEIISDKDLINHCHPIEALLLGIYNNLERNGILDEQTRQIPEIPIYILESYFPRCDSLFQIINISYLRNCYMLTLKSIKTSKKSFMPLTEFIKITPLLCGLDSITAVSLGYYVIEEIKLRDQHNATIKKSQ